MDDKHVFNINTKNGKIAKVFCNQCLNGTNHEILTSVEHNYEEGSYYSCFILYEILKCLGCETVSFRKCFKDNQGILYSINENGKEKWIDDSEIEEFFPARHKNSKSNLDFFELIQMPQKLRDIYDETLFALIHDQLLLASVGLRAMAETICKDKLHQGESIITSKERRLDLHERIGKLKDLGLISPDSAEILHSIRTMGKNSIHDIEKQDRQKLLLAFRVLEALIRVIYIFPAEHKA